MDISVSHLLRKMESELLKAKQADSASKLRESTHSIKILCELILEENETAAIQSRAVVNAPPPKSITPTSLSSKKLEMDEEANGESLLEF